MVPGDLLTVTDGDRDGIADVLIGKTDGTVHYLRNAGTTANPVFQLQNQQVGGFPFDRLVGARSLVVTDLNGDRKDELLVASNGGQVRVYQLPDRPFTDPTGQSLTMLDSLPALGTPGKGLLAAVADLDGDQLPDLMLGSAAGGLRYLKNTSQKMVVTGVTEEPVQPWVFPNPTNRYVTVRAPHNGHLELLSLTGQVVHSGPDVRVNVETTVDLGTLPGGTYVVRLTAPDRTSLVQKVVIWK